MPATGFTVHIGQVGGAGSQHIKGMLESRLPPRPILNKKKCKKQQGKKHG